MSKPSPTTLECEGSGIFSWHYKLRPQLCPNYAQVAEPLRCLLRKDVPWKWTVVQTSAYVSLKEKSAPSSVLAQFDPDALTIGTTDVTWYCLVCFFVSGNQWRKIPKCFCFQDLISSRNEVLCW